MISRHPIGTVVIASAICACGVSGSSSPSMTAQSTSAAVHEPAASQVLTLPEVQSAMRASTRSAPFTMVQTAEHPVGQVATSDARFFNSEDKAVYVEVSVVVDESVNKAAHLTGDASADFAGFDVGAQQLVAHIDHVTHPILGQKASEYAGADDKGRSTCAVVFVKGSAVALVLVTWPSTRIDTPAFDALAAAEAGKVAG